MFGLFKKNAANGKGNNEGRNTYDPDRVTVFYEARFYPQTTRLKL